MPKKVHRFKSQYNQRYLTYFHKIWFTHIHITTYTYSIASMSVIFLLLPPIKNFLCGIEEKVSILKINKMDKVTKYSRFVQNVANNIQ